MTDKKDDEPTSAEVAKNNDQGLASPIPADGGPWSLFGAPRDPAQFREALDARQRDQEEEKVRQGASDDIVSRAVREHAEARAKRLTNVKLVRDLTVKNTHRRTVNWARDEADARTTDVLQMKQALGLLDYRDQPGTTLRILEDLSSTELSDLIRVLYMQIYVMDARLLDMRAHHENNQRPPVLGGGIFRDRTDDDVDRRVDETFSPYERVDEAFAAYRAKTTEPDAPTMTAANSRQAGHDAAHQASPGRPVPVPPAPASMTVGGAASAYQRRAVGEELAELLKRQQLAGRPVALELELIARLLLAGASLNADLGGPH
jgi:hypothetical protein